MATDVISSLGALLKYSHGIGMSHVVYSRPSSTWCTVEIDGCQYPPKRPLDRRAIERFPPDGYKQVRISGRGFLPALQVVAKPNMRCLMQGHQATLMKLGFADHETIRCDVILAKGESFGDPESGRDKECEERVIGMI